MEEIIKEIQERNKRVELEKAWETSMTRRLIITCVTYLVAAIWLYLIHNDRPFLNALVPCAGYLLSTWSLPFIKEKWIRKQAIVSKKT